MKRCIFWRRQFFCSILAGSLSGCFATHYEYKAVILKNSAPQTKKNHYQSSKKYEVLFQQSSYNFGTALGCYLTLGFLGGLCWMYNEMPYESERNDLKNSAKIRIRKKLGRSYKIVDEKYSIIARTTLQDNFALYDLGAATP